MFCVGGVLKFEFSPKLNRVAPCQAWQAEAHLTRPHVLASFFGEAYFWTRNKQTTSTFYVSKLSWLSKFNCFNFLHQSAVDSKYILSFVFFQNILILLTPIAWLVEGFFFITHDKNSELNPRLAGWPLFRMVFSRRPGPSPPEQTHPRALHFFLAWR